MSALKNPELPIQNAAPPSSIDGWRALDKIALRQAAARAAAAHDGDALAALTATHLSHGGQSRQHAAQHTIRAYATTVRMVVAQWRDRDLSTITAADALLWLDSLRKGGAWHQDGTIGPAAAATVRVRLAGARALFDALSWAGLSRDNPFADLRAGQEGQHSAARGAYRIQEISQLLGIADRAEQMLILLAADTGLRIAEICALRVSDIDLQQCSITVSHPDGTPGITIAISTVVRDALESNGAAGSHTLLLPWTDSGARKRIRRLCARADVVYRGTDALRPGTASRSSRSSRLGQGRLFDPFALDQDGTEPDAASDSSNPSRGTNMRNNQTLNLVAP